MGFIFNGDAPRAAKGLPAERVTFTNGRTAVEMARHGGICGIQYYGNQRLGDVKLFECDALSAWTQIFRPFADFGRGDSWLLELENTTLYPFGCDSECTAGNVRFRHRMTVFNDAILWELECVDPAPARPWRMTVSSSWAGGPVRNPCRTWDEFIPLGRDAAQGACHERYPRARNRQAGTLTQGFIVRQTISSDTFMTMATDSPMTFRRSVNSGFRKVWFSTEDASGGYAAAVLAFGTDPDVSAERARTLAANARAAASDERAAYHAALRSNPRLKTGDSCVDSFFRNAPEVVRSFGVKDLPGAYRAADSGYWVWGWDSMVHSDALMLSGDWRGVADRLAYYHRNASRKWGIFHASSTDNHPLLAMAPAAQTIYCVMLYNFLLYSGNLPDCRTHYKFAVSLLDRVRADLVPGTGLYRGVSLYPDSPEDLGQDGNDIPAFNNSILFQAFRCMAAVARELGDSRADEFDRCADALAAGFRKHLYDPAEGYFLDSVSAATLEPRRHYPLYAILWLTPFAAELVAGIESTVAGYLRKKFTRPLGPSMFAADSPVFYSDGNQLGMYMAVIEGFYRRALRFLGAPDTMMAFIRREWSRWRLFEALTCEAVNSGITPDNPGRKQMFTATSWYSLLIGNACGLEFRFDRLAVGNPGADAAGWKLRNLRWRDGVLDFRFEGAGRTVAGITLDGEPVTGTAIPAARLTSGKHRILINLKENIQ